MHKKKTLAELFAHNAQTCVYYNVPAGLCAPKGMSAEHAVSTAMILLPCPSWALCKEKIDPAKLFAQRYVYYSVYSVSAELFA